MSSLSGQAARHRRDLTAQGLRARRQARAALGTDSTTGTSTGTSTGCGTETGGTTDLRTLDGELAILGGVIRDRLGDPATDLSREAIVALSQALHDLHQVRFSVHDHLNYERVRRLDALDHGLAGLRAVTDQDKLLHTVCEAAAEMCGFDRVMLSRVEDGIWRPWRSYAREVGPPEEAFIAWLRAVPEIRLSRMLLESEMLRRRQPVIVADATRDPRVFVPLARAADQTSYVAAPIVSGGRVIGLLHADNRDGDVVELDKEILGFFTIGFAQILERSVLLARLHDQRAQVMTLMRSVEAVLDELTFSEIELATRAETTVASVARPIRPVATERPPMADGLLTAREREVLALMATGATNDRIAQRLVIATDTVKSHVKQILRKLEVENRAEAISQYLRMTIGARD
jgi:DNA-binding CsgD family transcriptional regulator